MEINEEKMELMNHSITVSERQNIIISGITKIDSFDSEEFILQTVAGPLGIKGRKLEIIKLDTYEGTITIKGIIDGFSYLDNIKSKKENSMLNKLFKWWI